jgi:hypothetical protein
MNSSTILFLIPAIFILVCLISLVWPRGIWYLSVGWMVKNTEPSDAVLIMTRLGGGLGVMAGLALLFLFNNF